MLLVTSHDNVIMLLTRSNSELNAEIVLFINEDYFILFSKYFKNTKICVNDVHTFRKP